MFRTAPGTGTPPGRRRRLAGLTGLSLALLATGSPAVAGTASAAPGDGTVTVRVVTEVDADGAYDSVLEQGLAGVRVTLTDDAGAVRYATTGSNGLATFAATAQLTGGKYRVQVANPDPGTLSPAVAGLGTGADVIRSNVGFVDVSGGTDVTYTTGFWEPGVYCQENPDLVTCNLTKGDAPNTYKGLVSFGGEFTDTAPGGIVTQLTDNTRQQAVFGIGVDRTGNKYLGTLVKRHTAYGPLGNTNTIYRQFGTENAVTPFVTLPGTLTRHDPTNSWLHDDAVYSRVGREGVGDVDVSGDGRTLYAVNIAEAKLYSVPIVGTGNGVTSGTPVPYDIPRPAVCSGEWHPYGIGVRGKRVLVGGVCGAEGSVSAALPWGDPGQLSAHVYEFGNGAFSEIFTHALNYPRGCAYRFVGAAGPYRCTKPSTVGQVVSAEWEAWNQRVPGHETHSFFSAPQPMLTNIEIADNGDLVLGYRDRFGDMTGTATYAHGSTAGPLLTGISAGDVLRACKSGTTYTLESNGSCGALAGNKPANDEGPGGGEFYDDSASAGPAPGTIDAYHDQMTEGGTVLQPYRGKVWSTAYDPYGAFQQGVRRWTADTGAIEGNLLVQETWPATTALRQNLFGKANGLADLELVCDQAPVQIGNRVWYDSNGNGVQDPSEPPVPGVVVTLTPPTGPALTATTDANGEYYLGTAQGLLPNTAYTATFDYQGINSSALPGSPTLAELKWTQSGAGSDRALDSNVDAKGATGVTVGDPGSVNHTVDAGLVGSVNQLGDHVWYDADGDGIQDPSERGAKGIPVELIDPVTGDVLRTTTTDANGKYLFTALPDGTYKVCFRSPRGYLWTRPNAGGRGDDSVVDTATGCSPVVTLGPGNRIDLTLDAGLVKELGLTVVKSDKKSGKPLRGAVFQLWLDSNGKSGLQRSGAGRDRMVGDCVTNRNGRCHFDDGRIGTYYLVEKDVPEGYVLPKNPVFGPYRLTLANGTGTDGLVVKIANERGEPCKGKKC
ncbi:SdrD B-like domain-containing protein [Streptomyces geranii]|uniref:SdrD B-like domain-containing protein n=1 Tax=Streptomyces geranii TaxID=2058923 RepID=UPI001E551F36|nr:SdrD B-like domain-containing protein [Streptomyces geranii]